jgi:hypothetical protein
MTRLFEFFPFTSFTPCFAPFIHFGINLSVDEIRFLVFFIVRTGTKQTLLVVSKAFFISTSAKRVFSSRTDIRACSELHV